MAEFSEEETMLNEFYIKQGIPEFKIYVGNAKTQYEEFTGKKKTSGSWRFFIGLCAMVMFHSLFTPLYPTYNK